MKLTRFLGAYSVIAEGSLTENKRLLNIVIESRLKFILWLDYFDAELKVFFVSLLLVPN